jgi:hypothetical protein
VGGFIYGGIAGAIEGQSGNALLVHALQDAGIGALTGLTDGLNLGWQLAANVGINAAGEVYKKSLDQLSTGCGKFDGTKIAFAGAAGLVGDLGGKLIGSSFASGATELSHVLQESSEVTESLFGTNISGILGLAPSIITRAIGHFNCVSLQLRLSVFDANSVSRIHTIPEAITPRLIRHESIRNIIAKSGVRTDIATPAVPARQATTPSSR